MLALTILALAAATQFTPPTVDLSHPRETRRSISASADPVSPRDSALMHLERARVAEAAGDLSSAHTEYSRAMWLQRSAGVLPVDASYGAATVLVQLKRHREAADVLDQLAADANLLGDAETEARVLLDVVAVKSKHHRRVAARQDTLRLRALLCDERLTGDTRRLVKARLS
ncbi:MAG: hypothetical protein HEQ38_11150 [Gemmatimonas sp.]|uniref:hypothetical protein n=1 Tax=Gemmatimonas sp. TaxID=1962908 RepID=UPI0031BE1A8C|nr:hypothetical protein [Gemmatimonas sp.]